MECDDKCESNSSVSLICNNQPTNAQSLYMKTVHLLGNYYRVVIINTQYE